MNFRTTLILLIVLTGVAVFVFFANHSSDTDQTTDNPNPADVTKGRKLFDTKTEEVSKLVIQPAEGAPAGSKTIELDKDAAKWKLVQPVAWPADTFDAGGLVEGFLNLRSHGKVELTSDNRSATGLDKPRFRVELTDKAGKTTKLTIGNRSALGNDMYISTDEGTSGELTSVGTLGDKLDKTSDKLVESLRDKQLVRATSSDVKQIELTRAGGETLVLNKVGDDWKLVSPKAEEAESSEVSDLLSTVTGLRADEFVDTSSPAVALAQFDKPRATVWVSTAAATTQPATTKPAGVTITIGQPTDVELEKAYVKVSDPNVIARTSLTQATFDKLLKASPLSLRDRKALNIDPAKVSEVLLAIDRPATTQPTTKPAEQRAFDFTRRKENLSFGPVLPGVSTPTTSPTTEPTTAPAAIPATTSPTTAPATTSPTTAPTTQATGAGSFLAPGQVAAASDRRLRLRDARLRDPQVRERDHSTSPGTAIVTPLFALTGEISTTESTTTKSTTDPATLPVIPTTGPAATEPTTGALATTVPIATTEPTPASTTQAVATTAPIAPPAPVVPPPPASKWVIQSEAGISADDDQVKDLLDALHPLKAEKYLASAPTTRPMANYTLTIKTIGAGGADTATYELHITDPGGENKLIGTYNDLAFELDRSLLKKLDGDFKTRRPPEPPSAPPPSFQGGGFPGGFPPGGQ